jgi:hypothetical protein
MLYRVGRLLQLIGLILLPIAMAGNFAEMAGMENRLDLRESLILSGIGIALFYLGWRMQESARPS